MTTEAGVSQRAPNDPLGALKRVWRNEWWIILPLFGVIALLGGTVFRPF